MSNSTFWPSFLKIVGLLLLIFLLKLLSLTMLSSIVTLLLAFFAFRSPKPLFWFTLAFIYSNSPAGLFDAYTFGLSFGAVVIDVVQLLTIALILNLLGKRPPAPVFFRSFLYAILVLVIVNVVLGVITGVDDSKIFMRIFKVILPFGLIFVGFRVFRSDEDFRYFFLLIFPWALVAFLSQVFIYFSGTPLATLVFGQETILGTEILAEAELSRYIFSLFLLSTAFMGALFYLGIRIKHFNNWYLATIVFTVMISFLLSGTRGWTLGFGTMLILWVLTVFRRLATAIPLVFVSIVLVLILSSLVPAFNAQLQLAYDRLITVELLAEGDITAGGTLQRFDVRAPRLMGYFLETNLLLGAGYSQFLFDHQDGHIGHHNLLFQSGIIGFLLVYGMFLFMMTRLLQIYKLQPHTWESGYTVFVIMLIGMLLIHTSVQVFTFTPVPPNGAFYAFLFAFGNYAYHRALQERSMFNNKPTHTHT